MKLTLCVLVTLSCLGAALGQCPVVNGFTAYTMDALKFTVSRSYHGFNALTLYELEDGQGVKLFDFNNGTVFERDADGNCVEYQSQDLKLATLDPTVLASGTTQAFNTNDRDGVNRAGLSVTNGDLVVNNVSDGCYGVFISFEFGGQVKWAFSFLNQKPLSVEELEHIIAVREEFANAECDVVPI